MKPVFQLLHEQNKTVKDVEATQVFETYEAIKDVEEIKDDKDIEDGEAIYFDEAGGVING